MYARQLKVKHLQQIRDSVRLYAHYDRMRGLHEYEFTLNEDTYILQFLMLKERRFVVLQAVHLRKGGYRLIRDYDTIHELAELFLKYMVWKSPQARGAALPV